MITILSIPRSGTRFFAYFVLYVLKLDVKYLHFFRCNAKEIEELLESDETIIVPVREYEKHAKSFEPFPVYRERLDDEFIPVMKLYEPLLREAGAHFIDIDMNEKTHDQIDRLLKDLGIEWNEEISQYVEQWHRVGSQFDGDDKRSARVLDKLL